jgi:murein tripeptide amidase MpaA
MRIATTALAALLAAGCAFAPNERQEPLVASDGTIDWNRYYTHDETNAIMRELERRYPQLIRVRTIGESYLGAPLTLAEVTNRATGEPETKPALYLDGGIHAQELTASSVALYVLAHLVQQYGTDPQATALLDTRTFYIRPKFNPDGSDLVLMEDQWLRSSVRPVDDNNDGIPDSDPPEDLDGDGRILDMLVPDPDGVWRRDATDPRILVRRQDGDEGPFYRREREGLDRNGDGIINSDGIGGLDMNRNYPRNWERQHIQPGAGAFPLSEPETYATVRFISDHPNIGSIVHGHTSGGFIYRLPSAMDPRDMPATDLAVVLELGDFYTRDTGRRVIPSATDPVERRYGTLIGWGYWDRGIIGWVPEYSPPPADWVPDADGDGRITEADWHAFNDERFGGRYFQEWTPFDHPQLGTVYIGGWHTKFWGQNPPAELLEQELVVQLPWILHLAGQLPQVEVRTPAVTALGDGRFRVDVTVASSGYLPTHLTDRGHEGRPVRDGSLADQVVQPPLVVLEADGARIEEGSGRVRTGHLAGTNGHLGAVSARERTVSFIVSRERADATVRARVEAGPAGIVVSEGVRLP